MDRTGAGRAEGLRGMVGVAAQKEPGAKPPARKHKLTSRFVSRITKGVLCLCTIVVLSFSVFQREPIASRNVVIEPELRRVQPMTQCPVTMENKLKMSEKPETTEFAVQEYRRHECLRSVQQKLIDEFEPYFSKYPGGVALVDVALHTNLGDNILWRGAIALLAEFGISPGIVCYISQPAWVEAIDKGFHECTRERVLDVVKDKGLVLFHAGGNWGDLYRFVQDKRLEWLVMLNEDAKTNGFGIIQLPQSIYYTPNSKWLAKDREVLYGLDRAAFTLFVRSRESYEFAKKTYNNTEIKLAPDIAFAIGPITTPCTPVVDVLIQLRQDKEVQKVDSHLWGWVDSKFNASKLTYHVQDWWYNVEEHKREFSSEAPTVFSEVRMSAASGTISQGRVVITNRLHGSIIATLLGKHLFYVDTKEGKLQSVRSNSFLGSELCSSENLHSHRMENMSSAVDSAIDLLLSRG